MVVTISLALAWRNLPSLDALTDYRPKVPLRVYTADNKLIGEFGEERRSVVRIGDFPTIMKQAVLAAEDDRFYAHRGIDYMGILRAAFANFTAGAARQGGSTITQQVARNFFLSSERTYTRKLYEVLLAFRIEGSLTKDQILEIYMNQIFLGQRSFGFAQAAQAYFGKDVRKLSVAECAMLAGLPKAPSTYNPVVNPKRAQIRQQYVLGRMRQLNYIDEAQYKAALAEKLSVRSSPTEYATHGDYVAEMARQLVQDMYRDETYSRGLNVYTTITTADQDAAYAAVRRGVLEYDRRHGYRGPEGFLDLRSVGDDEAIDSAVERYADADNMLAAVVTEASPRLVRVRRGGDTIDITDAGLRFVASSLNASAQPSKRIRRGAIVRISKSEKGAWEITQLPEVETAFVSMDPNNGAVRALVGGFDFNRNKFNHVTQAWRQPGSGFKPFVYSASLEKGLSPATIINDSPIVFTSAQTGGQHWEPKNYDGKYDGPMTMRQALTKSKNMVSIRIIQAITPKYTQEFVTRFGFDADKHPPYLTMALGAGSVTPWQLAAGYTVFANGGYKIKPYIVTKITDSNGTVLAEAQPEKAGNEALRVIDPRNAFLMDSMMKDVARYGTAARATSLKRPDVAGKTGTTNDSYDAWFAGYTPGLVAVAWMGYDQPRSLGEKETGGGASLPIWLGYMQKALTNVEVVERDPPEGILAVNGDYFYAENIPGGTGVASLGLTESTPEGEKKSEAIKSELF
ncbi:MAG TPA: penicillin-binding protein 1A [Burkholderiaceae bacterium]|nr:penicillin-binding protein 1A [Burkholderiaceae bacterium]